MSSPGSRHGQGIEYPGRNRRNDLHVVAQMYATGYYEDGGYGFPVINRKRPFGNSFWKGDILEELKIEPCAGHKCDGDCSVAEQAIQYADDLMQGVPEYLAEVLAKTQEGK